MRQGLNGETCGMRHPRKTMHPFTQILRQLSMTKVYGGTHGCSMCYRKVYTWPATINRTTNKEDKDIKYLRKEINLYLIWNMTKIWLDHIQWSISLIITNINNDNYTEENGKKYCTSNCIKSDWYKFVMKKRKKKERKKNKFIQSYKPLEKYTNDMIQMTK